jgi:hypothetical protein
MLAEEGISARHPIVRAVLSHLEVQRSRAARLAEQATASALGRFDSEGPVLTVKVVARTELPALEETTHEDASTAHGVDHPAGCGRLGCCGPSREWPGNPCRRRRDAPRCSVDEDETELGSPTPPPSAPQIGAWGNQRNRPTVLGFSRPANAPTLSRSPRLGRRCMSLLTSPLGLRGWRKKRRTGVPRSAPSVSPPVLRDQRLSPGHCSAPALPEGPAESPGKAPDGGGS